MPATPNAINNAAAVIIIFLETIFLSDTPIRAVMEISKVMLPIGLMTTNSETEDLSKLLLNVSDMLNLVLKPVTNCVTRYDIGVSAVDCCDMRLPI